ncbi:GntR family transcriptional regulator [Maritalea porphyrae]|uniref:GntR family transcriptional regulator n=1 Tax=Maritalea porphyrae TaxID=880732 RepID=UPI0022AF9643|nr:GntR family transcriptional regulator [Maritalea porphyrae]MCZ4274140.1 GntR family transcriptional regulator [Maritalea porphyrae]
MSSLFQNKRRILRDGVDLNIQVREIIVHQILTKQIVAGDQLPSIRTAGIYLGVNSATISRGYHALIELGAIERRRGLGMFVTSEAQKLLLKHERQKFLKQDWPTICHRIRSLDIVLGDLRK